MLSSIPKPYTLNNKEAKNGKQRFSHKTHKKSFSSVCLFVSLFCRSLSLSLSLSVEFFGSLEADTSFEEEELRFLSNEISRAAS